MDNLNHLFETIREDDFVEYYLFPQILPKDEKQQEELLEIVLAKVNSVLEKYTKDYLWHKDPIQFAIRTSLSNYFTHLDGKTEQLPPHLHGVSHYGDNIEDEWFIVFLLQEITREIEGIVARVYDSDGEFLLIEAANFLPNWANPEVCENRVYIYKGSLHLIAPDDMESTDITVEDALNKIWTEAKSTIASPDTQNCIRNKLITYPDNIKKNFHHATVYVPVAVAAILKEKPSLISAAVQAFCNRDPVDLKACRAMKYFPPEQRVKARLKFTRCLYAMLLHSKYVPEKKIGWNLPPTTSKDYKPHNLGVKIACGFEILVSQAKPSQDVEGEKGWIQYLKSLSDKGYFEGLLEGSKEYTNRLNKAKLYYSEHRDSMHYSPAIGQEILEILKNSEFDYDTLYQQGAKLPEDDDDSWLDISSEELDKMLQDRYGQTNFTKVDESTNPGNFAEKVNRFLNHISDVDGAEFPSKEAKNGGDESPTRPPRGQKKAKKGVSFSSNIRYDAKENKNKVDFDPNSFANAVKSILNFVIPEDDSWTMESESDMSEYESEDYVEEGDLNGSKKINKLEKYMAQMDLELSQTTIGQSFEKKKRTADAEFDDVENFEPVDIDVNALTNILQSYRAELGEPGPSSTMLGPMGVRLDPRE